MKRHFLGFCLAAVLLIGVFCPLARAETPDFPAQALVLMEASTGQVLYEKSAHVQRPCASITKVMTLLLVFEAIDAGTLHLDDVLTASAHAAGMGGSMGSSISISTDAGAQIASDLGKGVIQGVSQYITKKMRTVKVTLKAGHRLLLHSPKQ